MSLNEETKPGDARCPDHPSTKELIKNDKGGAPKPLLEESYNFLGDEDIPYERYTSEKFARAEDEHMWSKVWQWACREEHIPEPGIIMFMMLEIVQL